MNRLLVALFTIAFQSLAAIPAIAVPHSALIDRFGPLGDAGFFEALDLSPTSATPALATGE